MTETAVLDSLAALEARLSKLSQNGQRLGLVPTMGNLHAGHLTLIAAARKHSDFVLATIFVNPSQFGPNEDFDKYPRTFSADLEALTQAGCDAVFVPAVKDIYPDGPQQHTQISVPCVSSLHCGASRPGHFDGVCTVVYKLLSLTKPDLAVFGLKDYQQFHIISKMVNDLLLPVELLGIPTVREPSGLALSSRNAYLSETEKHHAAMIHATLSTTATQIKSGNRDFRTLEQTARETLQAHAMRVDYFTICDKSSLQAAEPESVGLIILCAVFAGQTRLIDNIQL